MLTQERLEEVRVRLNKAHDEICALAARKKEFSMTIPPDMTRDSDMVLQAPLDDLDVLLREVERLNKVVAMRSEV